MQKYIEKYQLEALDEKDLIVLRRITNDLKSNRFIKSRLALSFAKTEEQAKITYLSTIVEQNWMMIRQHSRLNSNTEKLKEKLDR